MISCFSYTGFKDYHFDPEHIQADLRRIYRHYYKKLRIPPDQIMVAHDLKVCPKKLTQIQSLQKQGYTMTKIWNLIKDQAVIEFIEVFSKVWSPIKQSITNQSYLNFIASGQGKLIKKWVYFSGHSIIVNQKIKYLVPSINQLKMLTISKLAETLVNYCYPELEGHSNEEIFILIIDCCYGGLIIDNLEKILSRESRTGRYLMISSTQSDQSCGFFKDHRKGSLFTYYFLKELINRSIIDQAKLNLKINTQVQNQLKPKVMIKRN